MHGAKNTESRLESIYGRLSERYSPCNWWPAESPFEVILGAILTQNTSWKNVEKALENLKSICTLDPDDVASLSDEDLLNAIRPSGFYRQKAKTIKSFTEYYKRKYNGKINNVFKESLDVIRKDLLCIKGIGEETADCILLYAFNKPAFVVDKYTKRILSRVGLIETGIANKLLKDIIEKSFHNNVLLYNELHALFVNLGKEYCHKIPECINCPLSEDCLYCLNSDRKETR